MSGAAPEADAAEAGGAGASDSRDASGPAALYAERREAREAEAERLRRRDRRVARTRLVVFAALVLVAALSLGAERLSPVWLLPPALAFLVLLAVHEAVLRSLGRAERAAAFYEDALARVAHRFAGRGHAGERFRDPEHPYAEDLDLFGAGGLYERLCTARTRGGGARLAEWLLAPSAPETVRARQAAVAELAPRVALRETLALVEGAGEGGAQAEEAEPRAWAERPARFRGRLVRIVAPLLAAASVASLGAWVLGAAGPLPLVLALAVQAGFGWALRARVRLVAAEAEEPLRELALVAETADALEAERFESPALVELRRSLEGSGASAARRVASLRRRVMALEARRNALLVPVVALLLGTTQAALAVEAWRARFGAEVARWTRAVGELEALVALAAFAFDHPGHAYPELAAEGGPRFEARALGHPLLPDERCVRNDVALGERPQVLVVSGSNMSGKSTLLRAVGVNAVLAQAGAPVRAEALRMTPLAVGAQIRVHDSLQEGVSRFYAEIRRLRQILEIAGGEPPLLFLLDEVLHGTNSHDRGVGAEAVLRALVERGALGLVTTHDLALAAVPERLGPRAANVHFEDHMEGGRIAFDYRMREGVVERSNALALMRAVGLPV